MKTLAEQVNEIMNEATTDNIKRKKLLKIGLTNMDVMQLFHAAKIAPKYGKKVLRDLFGTYTFGVEIECYNVYKSGLIREAATRGVTMRNESYNHRDNNYYFKLVSDASIVGNDPIECVSPILRGEQGLNMLKACSESLNAIGAKCNRSTGLHIHIGGNISEEQYCNVFVNYYYLESVIDSFMPRSRRNNTYSMNFENIDETALINAKNHNDIRYLFHNDRYYKINCRSYERHQTIEFRQHNGTIKYDRISNWALFCLKLVQWSELNRLTEKVATIDDIPFLDEEQKNWFKGRQIKFANQ